MKKIAGLIAGLLFYCGSVAQNSPSQVAANPPSHAEGLAVTSPMGWNSYDSYGTTIDESQFRAASAAISRHLKASGWQYAVIDMEWFVENPTPAGNGRNSRVDLDPYGRYVPAANRFPSAANGAGFKPLADYVHSLGLKFGIHMLRGIPRKAVAENLPIAGSSYHASDAADAADTSDACPWNPDNYGVRDTPEGRAYYDSVAQLYAQWGVDLVKVDCIASHPYKGDEIRMLSAALRATGRPIVLSLSPGPAPIDKVEEIKQSAQMWRISDDVWDLWHSTVRYPQGVVDQFPRAAEWTKFSEADHWPDADMLPLGYLGPAPGWGEARATRLTHDEQRTLMTLWCMMRSPLMWGGNPERLDGWTLSLLSNLEVLEVDQHSVHNHAVLQNETAAVWLAQPAHGSGDYVAVFNLQHSAQKVRFAWRDLSLSGVKYAVRDLWERKNLGTKAALEVDLPPHGTVLYKLSAR